LTAIVPPHHIAPSCAPAAKDPETSMTPADAANTRIAELIKSNDVVLFMKGNKSAAQCGFSHQVDQILQHLGVAYKDVNVLADPALRDGVKTFSNWPTIPQLYIKGEFVGGCDIVREMFQQGELKAMLDDKGVSYSSKTMVA
jgi:monothiol glutaredoxin